MGKVRQTNQSIGGFRRLDSSKDRHLHGLSGQGAFELYRQIAGMDAREQVTGNALRFPMPMALCSYCLGETKIGKEYQVGNVRKMQWNK
mgnify:CR=1 FL=1